MRRLAILFVTLAALLLFQTKAFAVVDVEARYWFTNIDGEATATSGAVIGTNVNFVDDLGMEENKGFVEGRITFELGGHKVRYGYMPMTWDGTRTITQSISFAGQTFSASTSVDTEVEINLHRLGYEYDFIDFANNKIGAIIEMKYIDAQINLKDSALGLDETESLDIPIPTIGVAASVGLPFLVEVSGEVTGLTLGSQAYLIDGEVAVNFKPAPFVVLAAGYRYMDFHVEKNDNQVDIRLQGPFITLKADF
ncbi:MAG: hypothetical protein ACE5EB_02145 [Thermodesulfobacteriota bacterium]